MSEEKPIEIIAKSTFVLFIGMFIAKFVSFLYRIVLSQLGPETYGIFSLILAYYGFAFALSLSGLDKGVARYVSYYLGKNDEDRIHGTLINTFKLSIPIVFSLLLISLFFAKDIAIHLFHNESISPYIMLITLILPFDVARNILFGIMRSFKKIKYEVYSKMLTENITKLFLTTVFVLLGYKILGVIVAYMIAIVLSFTVSLYFVQKKVYPYFTKKVLRVENRREILFFSVPVLFGGILTIIITWMDTVMIGFFSTADQVGIYNVAVPLAQLMPVFPVTLLTLFMPVLTEIYSKGNKLEIKDTTKIINKWVFSINAFVLITFGLFGKYIIENLFGVEYISASTSLLILVVANFLFFQTYASQMLLLVYGKSKLVMINSGIVALVNIILNSIFIPKYGIVGAATATGISFIIMAILQGCEIYKISGISPFVNKFVRITLLVGVPTATISPPLSPASGPRSMI